MPTPANRPALPPQGGVTFKPEWVAGLRAGDPAAFDAIFRAYYGHLCEVASGYLRSDAAAEDLVQELFLRLWRQRDAVDIAGSLDGYLFRAVRNSALNRLRRQHIEDRWQHAESRRGVQVVGAADESTAERDVAQAIATAIDELPERRRQIFTMNRYHGLTYDQIAAALALSRKTVETQMGRALRALRTKLAPYR